MLSPLSRRRRRRDELQLALDFSAPIAPPPPATAAELLVRLRRLGLSRRIDRLRLTRNRTVMVSFNGGELRLHEGYLRAPMPVLAAIVSFVRARTRADRARARREILAYQIERKPGARRPQRTAAEDEVLLAELQAWHARYNQLHFAGRLRPVMVRISRRMKTRLGHYTAASPTGEPAEIALSRSHIQKHGWAEALHTLLHEMVHQWQDEVGHPIDHGATFRSKASDVGITPSARRTVPRARRKGTGRTPLPFTLGLRAAREP